MPPRVLSLLAAALPAVVLSVACAPAVLGSRAAPFDLRTDRTVTATPASTVFVLAAFDHGAFGYRAQDFPGRWVPWRHELVAATVTAFFQVRELVGPDGWVVEVDQVRGFDRPGTAGVAIEATLRLEVPPGARSGGQRLRAVLEAQNGRRQAFELIVQVVP